MPDEPQRPASILPAEGAKGRLGKVVGGAGAAALLLGLLATFEGKSNDPYLDIVKVPTVCYGETRVEMKHYTDAECADMLADAAGDFAKGVLERNPELRGRPYQLVAASSLAYNIGLSNYRGSTAAKRFSAHDWKGGCAAILRWNRAGGKVVAGLTRRRNAEFRVCITNLKGDVK